MSTIIDKHGNIAFFGKLSWDNFMDWLVTLCLGTIIILTTLNLGSVRADTSLALLPLYILLLCLHGVWLLTNRESSRQLSLGPLLFLPALLWLFGSVWWLTPVPWLGWTELLYAVQAFIVLWVLSNNVQTRAQLWLLIIMSLAPAGLAIFNGFYQFFQSPSRLGGALIDYPLVLNAEFLGRATGVFADPYTYAAFLIVLLPSILIATVVRRLPKILRVLSFYIALALIVSITLTQVYWAALVMIILLGLVPWFCFRQVKWRILFSLVSMALVSILLALVVAYHPLFEKSFADAVSEEGEAGVRLVLWEEALVMAKANPVSGVGAGAYRIAFEQSSERSLTRLPESPQNDYLLILSQLGVVGFCLFMLPIFYVLAKSFSALRKEPHGLKLRDREGVIMPPQRFFLSIGLTGCIAFGLCMFTTFTFYVPALTLYGVLWFSILVKTSFRNSWSLGQHRFIRLACCLLASGFGVAFYAVASDKLESRGLESRANQELDHLVEMRIHLSGNTDLLDQVILQFEEALLADSRNVDAWLGLSSALCQLYYRSPADFEVHSARAVDSAQRAVALSPHYWRTWAQLGVAYSFNAEPEQAEAALLQALERAPNSSDAHYYYGAFIGAEASRREEALGHARRALEINPDNSVARRLEQKLLIF
ncbi:MAG: hypothetical protein EA353_10480 [Puniceicoccaceae bacterium]|nr:MAG: hypothetical protein EA353_10480 [Puniceicoccaceae bacterium]